jgi:Glycosyl hydrolase family 9
VAWHLHAATTSTLPYNNFVSSAVFLLCTESQARYMLGMRYRGNFVVGLSDKSPRQPRDRAASCPVNYRTPCNSATAAMPDRPNPHVLTGALVNILNASVVHKFFCLTWC